MSHNMYRKCAKCGRSPQQVPGFKLSRFPKPGTKNAIRCESWARYCFPNSSWSSQDFQQQLYNENKVLCSEDQSLALQEYLGSSSSQELAITEIHNVNGLDQKIILPDVQTKDPSLQVLIDPSKYIAKTDVKQNEQSMQSQKQILYSANLLSNNLNKNLLKLVDPKTLVKKPQTQTLISTQQNTQTHNECLSIQKNNIIFTKFISESQLNSLPKIYINQDSQLIQSPQYGNSNKQIKTNIPEEETFNLNHNKLNNICTKFSTETVLKTENKVGHSNEQEVLSKKTEVKSRNQNYIHISDKVVPPRAVAVLPAILQIRKGEVSPRRTIPARSRFGPVQGVNRTVTQSDAQMLVQNLDKPVFLYKNENGSIIHIDVTDEDKSNWISLLQLGDQATANVWLYEEANKLYAFTTVPINARTVLKIGYSKKYFEDHKFPSGVPVMDLDAVLSGNPKQWWCNECHRALPSATLLQRHLDVYHKDEIINTRRGYRCQHCKRTFSRLFTVRRHILSYCSKKPKEKPEKESEANSALDATNSINNDDNRIPSDESFQNFTNSLDFSTNLFDTDRISNLDISMSSKPDKDEFNPYTVGIKDDNAMSNVLSLPKLLAENAQNSDKMVENQTFDTCGYCNQVVPKDSKRKHVSECKSRKLECPCGRFFTNKRIYSDHIRKCQKIDNKTKQDEEKVEKNKYKCDLCESSFMRRGMLANHLWTKHNTVSTAPVELTIKHYPCIVCPKIYRSSTKRDQHIRVHHPGVQRARGIVIKSGVKSTEPASCMICPRQYATRAKLMQHMRSSHPTVTLGPAIKRRATQNSENEQKKY